jgi:VWFA-related protein
MFCPKCSAPDSGRRQFPTILLIILVVGVLAPLFGSSVDAQSFQRELETPETVSLVVRNRDGRVSVIASETQLKKVTIDATSAGLPVEPSDITAEAKGGRVEIDVRSRRQQDRIDIVVHVPLRSRVEVQSDAGAVDVVGNVESATVTTDTGTIHADIPLDAVKLDFTWAASKPRYMSDVELPEVKEKAGGVFRISGKLGDEKAKKEGRVDLHFLTQRGVILLNIDPSLAPADLRERPLTNAAQAIVRSGDSQLVNAIRKVSPKMFGDYARTLPPIEKEPTLQKRSAPGQVVTPIDLQLKRFNASVTDRNGRAIGGMSESDFVVFENGIERRVTKVVPTNEPFNLVLLLDVSGSVQERMDFIRKAARDFLKTASRQDRIAIISFRDDVQVISDFSTDRGMLLRKLDEIDAGGGTALYDALGYVLVEPLKRVRGERTAVVVLSDGDDNKSFLPFPAILEALTESGALVYPLYVPSGLVPESSVPQPNRTIDPLRTRYLTLTTRADEEGRKLAAASGGVYYPIKRLEDLQKAYDDVVMQLRTAYTITYASNSHPSSPPRMRVLTNRDGASVRLSPVVGVSNP